MEKRELTPHQKKALQRDKHISVTANAGSGKTFVLTQRFLEILINDDVPLSQVAAITFTEKAAAELYKKISSAIMQLLLNADEEQKIKLEKLREEIVSARISTIHSFCQSILKEFPVQLSLDANFSVIDPLESEELLDDAVIKTIEDLFSNSETKKDLQELIRFFGSINQFSSNIKSLIHDRKNVEYIQRNIYSKSNNEIASFFKESFFNYAIQLLPCSVDTIFKKIKNINDFVLAKSNSQNAITINEILSNYKSTNSIELNFTLLHNLFEPLLTNSNTVRKTNYLGKNFDNFYDDTNLIFNFFSTLSKFSFSDNLDILHKQLVELGRKILMVFNKCNKNYSNKKKEKNGLDFEDLLILSKEALENEHIRKSLSSRYKYLMIDEYQDTNEIQYDIFIPILNNLREGNLFVVGDEKQSIYMFRDAELEVFNKTKKDIVENSGIEASVTLPESFRMAPVLAAFNNHIFKNIFQNANKLFNEVNYEEIICAKPLNEKGMVGILLNESPKKDNTISEEESIACKILELIEIQPLDEKLEWKNIAILARKRKYFAEFENVLQKFNIPYVLVGGKGYFQKQLIYDFSNYFSFLLNSNDDLSLAGILRSPFYMLSDVDLLFISRNNGYSLFDKLKNASASNEHYLNIYNQLKENLDLIKTTEIISVLRKITRETDYLAIISSRKDGPQQLSNYEKLISVTRNYTGLGFKHLYDYVNFLNDSIRDVEDEGQAAPDDTDNAVQIMTIHQAKGLEFKVVFITKCHDAPNNTELKAKSIYVSKEFGITSKLPNEKKYYEDYLVPPISSIENRVRVRKEIAEEKRLFYVAATRAENILFFSGLTPTKEKFKANSYFNLLDEVIDFNGNNDLVIKEDLTLYNSGEKKLFTEKIQIPIKTEINFSFTPKKGVSEKIQDKPKKIDISEITDIQFGDFISATKINMFNQCPTKYKLTYLLSFAPLQEKFKSSELNDELLFKETENESYPTDLKLNSTLKGRLIHKALEKNIEVSDSKKFFELMLNEENINEEKNNSILINELEALYNKFCQSKQYKDLELLGSKLNEYEMYIKFEDFYLYGVLDRIYLNNGNALIVDFKTDNIPADEINERMEQYSTQLEFYAYLTKRLFPDINNINSLLMFVHHPEIEIKKSYQLSDFNKFEKELREIIRRINAEEFVKNISHCRKCIYSDSNGNCIIK